MGRLIDANEFKRKLIHELNVSGEYTPYECGLDDAICWLDDAPTIEQYGTWIPCSERLPEESVKVLIFTDKGHCYIGRLYEENEWFCISEKLVASKVEFSKVIAWMPLPEPYREE